MTEIGIYNEAIEDVVDVIDTFGKPIVVYLQDGVLKTRQVYATNGRSPFRAPDCQVVGVYNIGIDYRDLVADIDYVRSQP